MDIKQFERQARSMRATLMARKHSPGQRLPRELRNLACEVARGGRAAGLSYRAIADAIGVNDQSLCRWLQDNLGRSDGARMVAVRLREAPRTNATPATMTLITPKGLRVEGLAVEQAVAILRALG